MSDAAISLVSRQSENSDRKSKANEILQWLIAQDIVRPQQSDCIGGPGDGYAMWEGARNVVAEPEQLAVCFQLQVNGLEVITERHVFHTGQHGLETVICPHCEQDIAGEDWSFMGEWDSGVSNNLTCPLCSHSGEIHSFAFTPAWGFSDLGFTFWNWPDFTDSFLEAFREKLNGEIDIVYSGI